MLSSNSELLVVCGIFLIILFAGMSYAGDSTTIEADIINVGSTSTNTSGTISIQVPDFIDFGEIDENGASEELKIYVNNTGQTAITLTPALIDYSDEIFTNLYFREFKTSSGSPVPQRKIGDWSVNISAPASSTTYRSKYFYMQLDLSDADIDLSSDLIGHRANVRFIATV